MDKKSSAILAGFSGRRNGSQLEPHLELICKLHRRGCAFREIVRILSENFGLTVAPSTVFRFVARQEQKRQSRKAKARNEKPFPAVRIVLEKPATAPASPDEIRQRIEALKQRRQELEPEKPIFHYDPDKPLTLVSNE